MTTPSNHYIQTLRALVGPQRIFVPGVRAILRNEHGEILLQRRSDMDLWGLPGGMVELNETVLQSLRREVWEETALTVLDAEPMGLYCGPDHHLEYPNGDQMQCFAIAFLVTRWEGTPRVNDHESLDLRFFAYSSIPSNLTTTHRLTLDDYARYQGRFLVT
ncbi:MAG: NUDIX domain-containing protein [bacterium]|jgi:ADP-ribose pyrophosphatase YjhB (NUDIX family)|nr:NUDIX domain-containing protein [bacterium]